RGSAGALGSFPGTCALGAHAVLSLVKARSLRTETRFCEGVLCFGPWSPASGISVGNMPPHGQPEGGSDGGQSPRATPVCPARVQKPVRNRRVCQTERKTACPSVLVALALPACGLLLAILLCPLICLVCAVAFLSPAVHLKASSVLHQRSQPSHLPSLLAGKARSRSSLFPIDDGLLDDSHNDQVGVLNSPACYSAHQNGERVERFSRKVFVGGLPPDIDEDEITASFRRFGPLVVDWPHKAESKSYFPPKGYAFLLFQEESSVQALIDACIEEDGKLYLCVSSPTIKDKPVQIRPWNLSDSDFVMDGSQPLDPRKTIFVGGVPRPLRAVELAMIMDRLYGGVCYAGIDTDPELKYPKGAGRVAFSNQQSYIAAISARFVQLQHGDIDKRVEVKPYVLDDQMCDECQGARCGGKFAPFFCANVTCLQYYCEFCWANIHSRAGREFHKPLVKEGADRPRQVHFRWN
ncbi:Cytoplasmic polyadenylation element-binding protein 2, partial [Galemys pyrenaicus]